MRVRNARNEAHPPMREMRRIPRSNFCEWVALHFGIRPFRAGVADNLARSTFNQ